MEENRCETVAGKVVKTRVDYWRVIQISAAFLRFSPLVSRVPGALVWRGPRTDGFFVAAFCHGQQRAPARGQQVAITPWLSFNATHSWPRLDPGPPWTSLALRARVFSPVPLRWRGRKPPRRWCCFVSLYIACLRFVESVNMIRIAFCARWERVNNVSTRTFLLARGLSSEDRTRLMRGSRELW